jgi:hypothetical protein
MVEIVLKLEMAPGRSRVRISCKLFRIYGASVFIRPGEIVEATCQRDGPISQNASLALEELKAQIK